MLGQELLQLIGIPSFHPGVLPGVKPPDATRGGWIIAAVVLTDALHPADAYPASYQLVALLLKGMAAADPTPTAILAPAANSSAGGPDPTG